jgi:hypothetical protein
MNRETLIKAIEDAAQSTGLAPATITSKATDNGRLYHRMKRGYGCHIDTATKILAFIANLPKVESAQ